MNFEIVLSSYLFSLKFFLWVWKIFQNSITAGEFLYIVDKNWGLWNLVLYLTSYRLIWPISSRNIHNPNWISKYKCSLKIGQQFWLGMKIDPFLTDISYCHTSLDIGIVSNSSQIQRWYPNHQVPLVRWRVGQVSSDIIPPGGCRPEGSTLELALVANPFCAYHIVNGLENYQKSM